jgi:long-chain acyl-CoA synthetase
MSKYCLQVDSDTGRHCTYAQLRHDVIHCAAALSHYGLRQGDRVCILLTNCLEYPIVFLAVMQLGAICVPLNYMLTKCTFINRC